MKLMIDISEEDFKSIKGSSFLGSSISVNRVLEAIKKGVKVPDIFFNPEPWTEEDFKRIEYALGFKLFTWQKTYILHGHFRRSGKTTAELLKMLVVDVDEDPIDLRKAHIPSRDQWYYDMMVDMYKHLRMAGIKTRKIIGYGGAEITV